NHVRDLPALRGATDRDTIRYTGRAIPASPRTATASRAQASDGRQSIAERQRLEAQRDGAKRPLEPVELGGEWQLHSGFARHAPVDAILGHPEHVDAVQEVRQLLVAAHEPVEDPLE